MDWVQLLVTILGSSGLTAIITGLFNTISNKQNNKYNEQRFEQEYKKIKDEQDLLNKKEQATNLYQIIKPALNNITIKEYMKSKSPYSINSLERLCKALENEKLIIKSYQDIYKWLKDGETILSGQGNIPFYKWVIQMFKDIIYKDCSDFINRYCVLDEYGLIKTVDKEKLNQDIEFINSTLNLYIEKF